VGVKLFHIIDEPTVTKFIMGFWDVALVVVPEQLSLSETAIVQPDVLTSAHIKQL